LVFAAFIDQLN